MRRLQHYRAASWVMELDRTRLQYHARRFREHAAPEVVLRKYAKRSETMQAKDLMRHICHVCAWVALAQPATSAGQLAGTSNLSPILVLLKMIRLRRHAQLDDKVRAALEAVTSCCRVALESDECDRREDWIKLKHALPCQRKRKRSESRSNNFEVNDVRDPRVDPQDQVEDVTSDDALFFKRAKRLNDGICKWRNCDSTELMSCTVAGIDRRLTSILNSTDVNTIALRKLLYGVIGALSPPRAISRSTDHTIPLDDIAAERLCRSAQIQKRVRKVIVRGLIAWREALNLEDVQIEPIITFLRHIIDAFETRHGGMERARASTQWQQLKAVIGPSEPCNSPETGADFEGGAEGEYWEPTADIQSLSTVSLAHLAKIQFSCANCAFKIVTDWYFTHPATGERRPLRPTPKGTRIRGHNCKVSNFVAPDGSKGINSIYEHLDFCVHNCRRRDCSRCNPTAFCEHGVRKRACAECKPARKQL